MIIRGEVPEWADESLGHFYGWGYGIVAYGDAYDQGDGYGGGDYDVYGEAGYGEEDK